MNSFINKQGCTGVYVGKNASAQGSALIARSADAGCLNVTAHLEVFGGNDSAHPKMLKSISGHVYNLPEKILRFITCPTNKSANRHSFYSFAINECGVAVSAAVTGYCSKTSLQHNPYVDGGISEDTLAAIVGAQARTSREGIQLIASLVDDVGSFEDNIIMIGDQKEIWYMEIYGGHQYCAIKAPDDCVACIGNEFAIRTEYLSCEAICSPELFELPKHEGFAQHDGEGNMDIFATYVGKANFLDTSHMRTWEGHRLMAESRSKNYESNAKLPLFYQPDKPQSVCNVMNIFRSRYQGTEFCPDDNGRDDIRPIACENQTKVHILQIHENVATEKSLVAWYTPSASEFATFVPICNCESKFNEAYTTDSPLDNVNVDSASVVYKKLNTLCSLNRSALAKGVKDFWNSWEQYATYSMQKLVCKSSSERIEEFCEYVQQCAFTEAKRLFDEAFLYSMQTDVTCNINMDFKTMQKQSWGFPDFAPQPNKTLFKKFAD